jgi:hypothetical protein
MVEQKRWPDKLEHKFRELEVKCLETMQTCWNYQPEQGVNIEMGADNDDENVEGITLSMNSDGKWNMAAGPLFPNDQPSIESIYWFETDIGTNPPLDNLLRCFALLNGNLRRRTRRWLKEGTLEERLTKHVTRNRRILAESLMESMEDFIKDNQDLPLLEITSK